MFAKELLRCPSDQYVFYSCKNRSMKMQKDTYAQCEIIDVLICKWHML